jgi:cobalt-zinc-cadmium efflux system outer membrane protein
LARSEALLNALISYYELAIAQQRVELLAHALENLDEAARILARREDAGTSSGYESMRLAIASELSRSRHAEAQGALEAARAQLASLLNLDAGSLRVAALSPSPLAPEVNTAHGGGQGVQALEQLAAAGQFAARAEQQAEWAGLPSVELKAGMKHVSDAGGGYGYVLGLSLSLPVFESGQALRAEAKAQRGLHLARRDALARKLSRQKARAQALHRAAQAELIRLEATTRAPVKALLLAAQSGYREGERSIVELLDAQRAETEVAERRLQLLVATKKAEARVRAASGELQ